MVRPSLRALLAAALTLPAAAACADDAGPAAPEIPPVALVTVSPTGGAEDVDVLTEVVVTFDGPLMDGMADYAALHLGDVTGPEVPGGWSLSPDGTVLTFTPADALLPDTRYTVHLGGGMMDAQGHYADLQAHGSQMGGAWATSGMMGGGGMGGGGMGSGMGGAMGDEHMGTGWQHPDNGSYGMVFTFTTGA